MEKLDLPNSICLAADVIDYVTIQKAIQTAEEKFGAVDCLINNAGAAKVATLLKLRILIFYQ